MFFVCLFVYCGYELDCHSHLLFSRMEKCIKEKEMLERELYNRFVLILNGKKAKIRTLQERIKQLENTIQEEKHR